MLTTTTERTASPASVRRALRQPGLVVEVAAVLLSPLLVVWPLRAQLWATAYWIDPFLHTAVIQHGRDVIERLGSNNRQFARAGLIVPARVFNAVFGDIPGYLVFRYVLALIAVIPAYLLFRRLFGRAAGAVAIVSVLANPVVLHAWGTDYGDSSAVAYLIGGTCALVMPTSSPRARLSWLAVAGLLLSLAVHSIMVTIPLVAIVVLVHLVLTFRRLGRGVWVDVAVLAGAFVLTTGVLVLMSKLLFNEANIFSPTWIAYRRLRQPAEIAIWHTPGARWALADPYLLVPPALVAAWAAVRLRRRHNVSIAEFTIVVSALLQFVVFVYLQFINTEQTLEFYFYSSLLWPAVVLVGAFVVVGLSRPLFIRPVTAWIPAAAVLLIPLAVHPFRADLYLRVAPIGLLVGVVIVGICLLMKAKALRAHLAVAALVTVAVVAASYVLLTGRNPATRYVPGQIHYPAATYASVIDTPYGSERDVYGVASQLHYIVPPPRQPGVPVMLWLPKGASEAINVTAAQYGWNPFTINRAMPELTPVALSFMRQKDPDYLIMLSDTGHEFAAGLRALSHDGLDPTVVRRATLHYGHAHVSVLVVSFGSTTGAVG